VHVFKCGFGFEFPEFGIQLRRGKKMELLAFVFQQEHTSGDRKSGKAAQSKYEVGERRSRIVLLILTISVQIARED
jgi:hypothetical protein